MPLASDDAFVLDRYPFGERDEIVVLFTKGHGIKRASAKGSRARLNRFAGALQSMNEIHATWFETEGKELVSLREAKAIREFFPAIGQGEEVAAVAAYAADHLRTFVQENETGSAYYRLAHHLQSSLLAGTPPILAARYVEVWILKISGVFPRLDACGVCSATLSPPVGEGEIAADEAGHFVCAGCSQGRRRFSTDAGRALRAILARPLTELAPLAAADAELAEIERLTRDVRRHFLGRELVSRSVVQRLLGE